MIPLADRRIDIGAAEAPERETEVRREHADDRVAFIVQGQAFAHSVWRGTEFAPPKVRADEGYRSCPDLIFARRKVAPERRLDAEQGEEVRGNELRAHAFGFARARQAEAEPAPDGHSGERLILFLPVTKIRVRERGDVKIRHSPVERHELLGLRVGQWIKQHAINY